MTIRCGARKNLFLRDGRTKGIYFSQYKKKKKLINFNLISSSSLSPVSNDRNHFFIDNNEISKILNDENFTREEKELIQITRN